MATVTPNFNWPVPTSTDLVKDGATAIEALGDSIDASLLDLKGGTTGQVLSKNSNTDMDFIWVTDAAGDITGVTAGTGISGGGTSGTVTVTNSMATAIDAKGDLVPGTGADTFARLAVGTNDSFLQAASGESTGLKWAGTYTTYTPTISATSGTITSTSVQGFRYLKIGNMVHVNGRVNVLNKGTGTGALRVTLPFTSSSIVDQMCTAEEIGVVGLACFGLVNAGTSVLELRQGNYGTVIQDNYGVSFSLTYEVA